MCNLYHMSPKGDAERYLGQSALLADYEAVHVGPFDAGLFIRPDGLVGQLGQWGLIRPGSPERV